MSKVILIEGLDGAGKGTAIESVKRALSDAGKEYVVFSDPGTTQLGSILRNYVKSTDTPELDSKSEILLFFLSRCTLIHELIEPSLAAGKYVILDRFYRTTIAYQGYGNNALNPSVDMLPTIHQLVDLLDLESIIDMEIYLDVDVPTSKERIQVRKGTACQIEARKDEFFEAARLGYLHEAQRLDYIHTVDATRSILEVSKDVTKLTNLLLGK